MRLLVPALVLILALASPLGAVVYVLPDDSKSLFRRDLLPLDTDTMRDLSGHLTNLARRDIGQDPIHWRATAQLLAVAIRLDPANRPARDLGKRLSAGDAQPPPEGIDFAHAISATWRIVDWLLHPESGAEGQLLGHQLVDALHVVDPRHPLATRYDAGGEATRWNGIVADLARFEARQPPADVPAPEPVAPPPPVARPAVLLRESSLKTPLFLYDDTLKLHLRLATVSMSIQPTEDPGPITFTLAPALESAVLDTARERARASLERTWPDLPLQTSVVLDTAGERYASRNTTAIAGPAALLMHAALEGRPLRDDLVFIGDLSPDGTLTRPRWSWDYLWALRSAEGGRLIVPTELQPELRAMLALENPGFFLKWEVLVASSLEAVLSLGSVNGDPEGVARASALFGELQTFAKGKETGPLCVNPKIRKRLQEDILTAAPFHFSATMLLQQGTLERPTRLEREVAARILRSGIEPLVPIGPATLSDLDPERIEAAIKASRATLEPFARSFREEEADLLKDALDLADLARNLRGGIEGGRPDANGNLVSPSGAPIATLHQQFQNALDALLAKLAPHTGETLAPQAASDSP